MAAFEVRPIGVIRTPFPDKFGVPRQPGLIPEVEGVIELSPWVGGPEVVRGLEGFSHVWVLWRFHHAKDVRRVIRPPRLKGRGRMGVLATRAPHRPNGIGMSVLPLRGIETRGGVRLRVGGADMVDGTPILDVKPYLAYTDSVPEARSGWAQLPVERTPVTFAPEIAAVLADQPALLRLIEGVLSLDPRPNSHHHRERPVYYVRIAGADVCWQVEGGAITVIGIELASGLHVGVAPRAAKEEPGGPRGTGGADAGDGDPGDGDKGGDAGGGDAG